MDTVFVSRAEGLGRQETSLSHAYSMLGVRVIMTSVLLYKDEMLRRGNLF